MLSITFNPTDRSEAVIAAILRNTFAETEVIDELFRTMKSLYPYVECNLNKFRYILSQFLNYNSSPDSVTNAEDMLTDLRKQVILFNELVSQIHEVCFQFLCILEETLKKIKIVLK
ncbi:hypothetical protein AVEN_129460-1 [Araneus ventricosus]|uniref:Uncharacterized protein n=1 Tax=Araneus ventricosus TaxID=182803 RepID=A0A4Y2VDU2_ARAVE|nr:hypothetical protein AVEN_129460-1 [Araneus ventricosus]